jgi:peptidyl-prolyl cis-trans isomerase A (cyclophilin A)
MRMTRALVTTFVFAAALGVRATPAAADDAVDEVLVADGIDHGKSFFLAIANSERSYLAGILGASVSYDKLRFEDPKCTKQYGKKGKVTRGKAKKFAGCLLALVRDQAAGELAFTAVVAAGKGVVVTAANSSVAIELVYKPNKAGDLLLASIRYVGPTTASATVGPPTVEDLAAYTQDLAGSGALTATIDTSFGAITCTLHEAKTPRAVANFVGLATGKKAWKDSTGAVRTGTSLYAGLTFHRVISGFMIQGGDPNGDGSGGPGYAFPDELAGLTNRRGSLVMANSGPDTNGSQFYINQVDNKHLDQLAFTIFGQCDTAVVDAIAAVPVDSRHLPRSTVTIHGISIARAK